MNDYLAALNECFPGWGDEAMFSWCFERIMAGHSADLLEVRDDGQLIAGSAISYRNVLLPGGEIVKAGIMTGSFTVPAARGRGLFSRMIDDSLAAIRRRESAMLLAFVTSTNGSCRRLAAAGATMVPSFYCRRAHGRVTPPVWTNAEDAARFVYTDDEWSSQFVDRPHPASLSVTDDFKAVVDGAGRMHFLQGDPRAIRELDVQFLFTTDAGKVPGGFEVVPGYLAVLGDIRPAKWELQNGDRM